MGNLPSPDTAPSASNEGATKSAAPVATGKEIFTAKKTRSKSFGPGGLEALKETSGNSTKVCYEFEECFKLQAADSVPARANSAAKIDFEALNTPFTAQGNTKSSSNK